ncbi:MAG: 1-acyl-sn-glycerol-3-phosphate acyltransferase [Bacteroidales bacterium]|nr:1-acyl-sn-glycerol-3-phosphate acyltransferase [Bacteroidales bacterium]
MKKIWIFFVKLFGWHLEVPDMTKRPELQHCVIAVAPHTCLEDYFCGVAELWAMGLNVRIFIKKEFFNWFTRGFLHHFGAVAVDRGNRHNGLVASAVEALNSNERLTIVITPEGTRKPVRRWKRGFYEIATQAGVPIVPGFVDFKTKTLGVGQAFYPTGDFEADLPRIMKLYEHVTPKYPEKYNRTVM